MFSSFTRCVTDRARKKDKKTVGSWNKMLPEIPIIEAALSFRRRTRYRIALHGRFRTKDRAAKSQFSDTLLDEVSVMLKKKFRNEGAVFDSTNLRKAWAEACHELGLGVKDGWRYHGLTIHDLRRSAVRNLIRAGVREDVSMSISGHKTRAVFSRYNITDTSDIREALIKVGQYAKVQERRARAK
jgi:hypothetical protein